jgi:hypothetical protein
MVICEKYGFVFVHIPKCAGTSIRQQIETVDPGNIVFGRVRAHPVLGKIDYGHIPLTQLRTHFPDAYDRLLRLDSFAICRDPLQRFVSSVRQTLWSYDRRPMTMIPKPELRRLTLGMIDELYRDIDDPPYKFAFFLRQSQFVYDGDRRIVRALYPIEEVPLVLDRLSRKIGRPLDTRRRSNQNIDLRFSGLAPFAYRLNEKLRRRLPQRLHVAIKDASLSLLARKPTATGNSELLEMPEVRQFVAEVYAGDAALYRQAIAETAALKAALVPAQ